MLAEPFVLPIKVIKVKELNVTHESGRVVVLDGLGVSEGLEDGVGLQQLLLQFTLCKNTNINIRAALTNVANRQKCNETYLPVNYTS